MQMLTKRQYKALVFRARKFANALTGDAAFVNPQVNRVALESMLVGWLSCQPCFLAYVSKCKKDHPREDVWTMAYDQALQAAQDAIFCDKEDGLAGYFYSGRELTIATKTTSFISPRNTKLVRRIAKAKANLGIQI